jgi:hypothetical protein
MLHRVLCCLLLFPGVVLAQAPASAPPAAHAPASEQAPPVLPAQPPTQPPTQTSGPTAVPADPSTAPPASVAPSAAPPPAGTAVSTDLTLAPDAGTTPAEPPASDADEKGAAPAGPAIAAAVPATEPDGDGLAFDGRERAGAELRSRELRVGETESRQKGLELALVEARFGIEYRALGWLSLQLEADFEGNPEVKDAFVRVENKRLRGQLGQFKLPVSALAMESPWKLPVPERGFIQNILAEHVQMLGRRQGVLGRYRPGGKLKAELSLGLFQGWLGNSEDPIEPDLNVEETFDSQNAVARLGARVLGIDLGLTGQRISTLVANRVRHFWTAGLDGTADYDLPSGGARLWVEGFTGTTWRVASSGMSQPEIQFFTARGVLAWRWGGVETEHAYIEPFVLGAMLDPDLETHSDLVWETMLGVNAGAWKRFRVGLTGKLGGSGHGVPQQLFVGNQLRDEKAVELQVGAAF